jgi:ABC-2 type transport system permease protein
VMGNGGYIVVDGTILETAAEVLVSTTAAPLAAHLVEAHVPPAAVQRAVHAGPVLVKQPMFNTVQGYASYVVPASTGLIVHQLLIIGICVVMGTWIERGRWTIAPQGRLSVRAFAGMLAGFWVFVWCAMLFWIGFVFWIYDLPRAGNLSAGILIGALYALAIAALGVSLGCWMADRERAFQIIGAVSIPLLFLSGFAFPVESIPVPMVWISYLLPSTHGIQALLKFNQMGATWREASPQVIRLIVVTLAYIALAWWMASRKAPGTALSALRDA